MRKLCYWISKLENKRIFKISLLSQNNIDIFTILIIFSALLMGYEIASPHPFLDDIQRVILFLFLIEIFLRMAVAYHHNYLSRHMKDGWTIFDIIVVGSGFIPSSFRKVSNVLRVLRVFRILRLVRAFPDIKLIVSIILKAIPRMSAIGALLLILIYIYAIIGIELFGSQQVQFSNFKQAFITLFTELTGETWPEMRNIGVRHFGYWTPTLYHVSWIIISSILMFNLFIGVIIDTFSSLRETELKRKKFRQLDIPEEYTLILGWNDNISFILKNLIQAHDSLSHSTIVVLAPRKMKDMEEYVEYSLYSKLVEEQRQHELILREGNFSNAHDLSLVINENCCSVIILPETSLIRDQKQRKIHDLKVISIITNLSGVIHHKQLPAPHIITAYYDESIKSYLPEDQKIISSEKITWLNPVRLTGKVLAQYSFSQSASLVIEKLFSYSDCELYQKQVSRKRNENTIPQALGKKISELRGSFHPAILLGWITKNEEIHFSCSTSLDYQLQEGDRLFFIADDKCNIKYHRWQKKLANSLPQAQEDISSITNSRSSQHILVIGWGSIVREYLKILEQSKNEIQVTLATDNVSHHAEVMEFFGQSSLPLRENLTFTNTTEALSFLNAKNCARYSHIMFVTSEIFDIETEITDILAVLKLRELIKKAKLKTRLIMEVNDVDFIPTVSMLNLNDVFCPDYFLMGYFSILSQDPSIQNVYRRISDCNTLQISLITQEKYQQSSRRMTLIGIYRHQRDSQGQRLFLAPDMRISKALQPKDRLIAIASS